jgi:inositol-phosphate transport system permease protein
MNSSRRLGLVLLAPAFVLVVLFFLVPVVLTAIFSFTTMSTATGLAGGAYHITPNTLRILADQYGAADLANKLGTQRYVVDKEGLSALAKLSVDKAIIEELRTNHLGEAYPSRREMERMIRDLGSRPSSTLEVKRISGALSESLANMRFAKAQDLIDAAKAVDSGLTDAQQQALLAATYTGWTWTLDNFRRLVSAPDSARELINTLLYVGFTLVLFNTSFAMLLAIATHFMPERPAGFFRMLWLVPRITPPVIYVLLWKWLAWDTGFLSTFLAHFDVRPRNWMLDTSANAWVAVVMINGFVGASMGMLIFASAIKAIPQSLFHASEVDGAYRWQQVRHIILPQLRWPILFVTCYQTLSLLTSFEYILLSTDGGPGRATEVWPLAIYHTALDNYAGNLQYGYGAAMALVLVVIGIALSLAYLRLFNYGALVATPLIER